jgi:hypothetical protein
VKTLRELLQEKVSGVFQLTGEAGLEKINEVASGFDCSVFHVFSKTIGNKRDFLAVTATSLNFPEYFGHNWDAFEECISDPDLTPNQTLIVILDDLTAFVKNEPDQFRTALDILRDAARAWSDAGKSLLVLVIHADVEELKMESIRV